MKVESIPDPSDETISVTATKAEWNRILKRIPWDASEETQELIYMLNDLGVDYL